MEAEAEDDEEAAVVEPGLRKTTNMPDYVALPQHSIVVPSFVQRRKGATHANYDDDVNQHKPKLTPTQVHVVAVKCSYCPCCEVVTGNKPFCQQH